MSPKVYLGTWLHRPLTVERLVAGFSYLEPFDMAKMPETIRRSPFSKGELIDFLPELIEHLESLGSYSEDLIRPLRIRLSALQQR